MTYSARGSSIRSIVLASAVASHAVVIAIDTRITVPAACAPSPGCSASSAADPSGNTAPPRAPVAMERAADPAHSLGPPVVVLVNVELVEMMKLAHFP